MKFSELKGRAVVNLEDAERIGTVEDLMVDPESHRIVSVKVRTGTFHAAQIIPVTDVKNVGGDAVTISSGAGMVSIPGTAESASGQYLEASQGSAASAASTPNTNFVAPMVSMGLQPIVEVTSLLGNKVVTDAGTMVGELRDVIVDWVGLAITGYEVHAGGFFTKAQEFIDAPGVRYGNKLITVPANLLTTPAKS